MLLYLDVTDDFLDKPDRNNPTEVEYSWREMQQSDNENGAQMGSKCVDSGGAGDSGKSGYYSTPW